MAGSVVVAPKKVASFRPSDELARMFEALETDMGITRTAVIEVSVREYFRKHFKGRKPPESEEKSPD